MLQSKSHKAECSVLQDTRQWILESDFDWHFLTQYSLTYRLRRTTYKTQFSTKLFQTIKRFISWTITWTHSDNKVWCAQSEAVLGGQNLLSLSYVSEDVEHQWGVIHQVFLILVITHGPFQRSAYCGEKWQILNVSFTNTHAFITSFFTHKLHYTNSVVSCFATLTKPCHFSHSEGLSSMHVLFLFRKVFLTPV